VRLARIRRPKIVCFPSYVDFRSRANTARGLDFVHKGMGGEMTQTLYAHINKKKKRSERRGDILKKSQLLL
jgi:hypothetical protein